MNSEKFQNTFSAIHYALYYYIKISVLVYYLTTINYYNNSYWWPINNVKRLGISLNKI